MAESITFDNVTFIIALGSAAFGVFLYLRRPQESLAKKQIASNGKSVLLAEKIKWERESNDKKFEEFGKRLDGAFTLASNHTHTVDVKVDKLIEIVGGMTNKVTELATIINERIPK